MGNFSSIQITFDQKPILEKETAKLFEALDTLTKTELTKFKKYLNSPFFGSDEKLLKLYNRFLTANGTNTTQIQGKNLINNTLGINNPSQGRSILKLKLKKMIDFLFDFLAHSTLLKQKQLRKKLAARALKNRNNASLYFSVLDDCENLLQKEVLTIHQLAESWEIHHQYYFNNFSQKLNHEATELDEAIHSLEEFYFTTKLAYQYEVSNRKGIIAERVNREKKLPPKPTSNSLAQLYLGITALSGSEFAPVKYNAFKRLFLKKQRSLSQNDRIMFTKWLINYLYKAYEKGNHILIHELLDMMKMALTNGTYVAEEVLSDDSFLNIAITALLAKDFAYFDFFIQQFKDSLEVSVREKALNLALAFNYFHKGSFNETILQLKSAFASHQQEELKYSLRIKTLLVRCYLEQFLMDFQSEEELQKTLDNFRKFLGRHKKSISFKNQQTYLNFLSFTKILYQVKKKHELANTAKEDLLYQLNQTPLIIARPWLAAKIENLS